ncbi:MAG: T9SS type A sorting domain-containing protein [Candidatus Symbiothrix sp.]|nr:T9SS type A sorting domain-containing protein [Candidatus Symbiothrix sp.]
MYYITNTEQKEYLNYSFEVLQAGIYNVDFSIATTTSGTEEKFYLEFDQKKTSNPRRYTATYTELSDLGTVTVPNIELSEGKHTVTFYPSGNLNFDKFTFTHTTGIREIEAARVSIFPNPSDGIFQIQTPQNGVVLITDISGKLVLKEKTNSANHTIDISNQAAGMYILSLQMNDQVYQSKLIKK